MQREPEWRAERCNLGSTKRQYTSLCFWHLGTEDTFSLTNLHSTCTFEISVASNHMFQNGWCGIHQVTDFDHFNWTRADYATPSKDTGPEHAYSGTHYIYMEASRPAKENQEAAWVGLFSFCHPAFDEQNGPWTEFPFRVCKDLLSINCVQFCHWQTLSVTFWSPTHCALLTSHLAKAKSCTGGGSRFVRMYLNRNWPKHVQKPNLCCVILHAKFKVCLNQGKRLGFVCSD